MSYIFVLFDANGKITDARVLSDSGTPLSVYANHIGLEVKVSEAVFRAGGRYAKSVFEAGVVLGPYPSNDAESRAATIMLASLAVDTGKALVDRATGNGA